jgi:LPXTG-motif cell wall-anchored protein
MRLRILTVLALAFGLMAAPSPISTATATPVATSDTAATSPAAAMEIATWSAVTDLSAPAEISSNTQVALSADGTKATAVWIRSDGSNAIVQSASATITGSTATWSTVTDLSAPGFAFTPQVALSADGSKATAIWTRWDSSFNGIVQSASATITGSTATWSTVTELSAPGQDATEPQVALSADGTKATAAWRSFDGSHRIAQSASATITGSTATWSTVTELSAPGQDAFIPQVALSADGTKATAIWVRFDGSHRIAQSASATITGSTATWSTVTDLSAPGLNTDDDPQVALSADGTTATAIWTRFDGSRRIAQSASATITGSTATWSSPAVDLSAPGQNASDPQVALSADGTKATAIWVRSGGPNDIAQSVSATITGSTATWSTVTNLSAPGQSADDPQVVLSADGTTATAVWSRFDGSNRIAQSASATITGSTATWSSPAVDLSAPGQDASIPQVALSADGTKATAVWASSDGDRGIAQSASATIPQRPGAPAGVTATSGDQQVTVSWNAPDSDGGSAITGYTVTGTPAAPCTTTGATSCVITGLTNETQYTFTVVATNAIGDGPASTSVTATPATPLTPPAPTEEATRVGTPSDGQLPRTGSTVGALITLAGVLCAAGYAMYASSRRRIKRS